MKYLFVALCLLLSSTNLFAQSEHKRLHNHITEEGAVYYIGNKALKGEKQGVSKFEYDLTYVVSRDSVTLNFTIVSDDPSNVTSLSLCNGATVIPATSVSLLYHETTKKRYLVRTTSQVAYSDIKKVFSSESPLKFCITRKDGKTNYAEYKQSQWAKETALFERIFYIINCQ